jgi:hypothetical protein
MEIDNTKAITLLCRILLTAKSSHKKNNPEDVRAHLNLGIMILMIQTQKAPSIGSQLVHYCIILSSFNRSIKKNLLLIVDKLSFMVEMIIEKLRNLSLKMYASGIISSLMNQ